MAQKQNMVLYIIKRILLLIPMVFGILILTWILSLLMAGDPSQRLFPIGTPIEVIEQYKQEMGFYDPWYIQLKNYLINFFKGELGVSQVVAPGIPVVEHLRVIIPRTLELALIPIIIIPIFGVKFGVISAKKRNKFSDTVIRGIAVAGVALPVFFIGMILQRFLGVLIPEFTNDMIKLPTVGFKSAGFPDPPFVTGFRIIDCILANEQVLLWDSIQHMILPILCMTIVSLSSITRITRSSMLDVLEKDYIRTARAKGCREDDVINKHALRNAMIPTTTVIVSGIAMHLTGSFLVEMTFNYNGVGMTLVNAMLYKDYWMINGVIIFVSFVLLIGNLIADVMYTIIDPRITYK